MIRAALFVPSARRHGLLPCICTAIAAPSPPAGIQQPVSDHVMRRRTRRSVSTCTRIKCVTVHDVHSLINTVCHLCCVLVDVFTLLWFRFDVLILSFVSQRICSESMSLRGQPMSNTSRNTPPTLRQRGRFLPQTCASGKLLTICPQKPD